MKLLSSIFSSGKKRKLPVGRLILLTGIAAASGGVAYGATTTPSELDRSTDTYTGTVPTTPSAMTDPAMDPNTTTTTNTKADSRNMKANRKGRPSLPACDKVNGNMECGGAGPKTRALKFPAPVEENITK